MKKAVLMLVLLSAGALAGGCRSMVYFRSNPEGARLVINGVPSGTTPCSAQLAWTTFTRFNIKLEKEGYRSFSAMLEGEPKWAWIIVDAFFLWPLLFVNAYGPKQAYDFTLVPMSAAPPAGDASRPPPAGETPGTPAAHGEVQVYENLKDRPRMACLELKPGNEEAGSYTTTLQEMFCTGFVESKRFAIIEREQIEKIFREKQFAQTGEVDAETARKLGKVLGVGYLLIGSVSKLGETFEIDARLVDVATGETKTASHGSCTSAARLRATANEIVNDLNRKFSGQ